MTSMGRLGSETRMSRDRTVKQSKADFLQLVKNTYRVLLSRNRRTAHLNFTECLRFVVRTGFGQLLRLGEGGPTAYLQLQSGRHN